MKILAIRIRNLASLEGDTEIDFTREPLCSAGIFAMTGPTGAGKSTILDALCLALYGKTPRYKQADSGVDVKNISQGDVRGILRDGTADGYAEVDFAGVDGLHYRTTWSVRRARNRADGRLQEYDIALKNISTGAELPGKKTELLKEIERLIGLSFEQFTRSVLLAQGEFTAFLKAGKDEKSSLLEKLTGTQIYSAISVRIFERYKDETLKLRDLNTQRNGIPTLTPEELEQLSRQQETLTISLQTLEQQLNQLNKEIGWYQQLHNLQLQVDAGEKRHTEATTARTNAAPRIAKFQQVERVQAVRTPVENLLTIKPQLARQEEQLQQQKELLALLIKEQEQHFQFVLQAEDSLAATMQEQEEATPVLIRARELDVQLTEKNQQITLAEEELKNTQEKLRQVNETLNSRQQEEKEVAKELVRLAQWKTDNASLQKIAEHESLVIARLQDAAKALNTATETSQQIRSLDKNIERKQTEREEATKEQQTTEEALKVIRQEYEAVQSVIAAIPLQSLEQEKGVIDEAVQQLTQAVAQWQLVYAAKQELKQADERMGKLKQSLDDHTRLLTPAEASFNNARLQKEVAQQLLDKARLAAKENVQELRQQLVHNEPCPVCGSTEHPYVSENPQLQHVLSELEIAVRLKDQEFTSQLGEYSRLQEVVRKLTSDIKLQEDEQSRKQLQAEELGSLWVSSTVSAESISIADTEKTGWLQSRLQQHKNRRQELQQQLMAVRTRQEQADAKRNECEQLQKQAFEIDNRIKDTVREIKSLQVQREQRNLELQNAHATHRTIKTELEAYFKADNRLTEWESGSHTLITWVQQNVSDWKNNVRSLDELALHKNTLTVTLASLQEQVAATGKEVELKQQNLDERKRRYNIVATGRRALFGGKPVIEVEKAIQAAIDNARFQVDESRKKREHLQEKHTRTTTQIEHAGSQVNILKQQQYQLQAQVAKWLSTYNESGSDVLTEDQLVELLNFNTDWIDNERSVIQELNFALSRAHAVLVERQNALEQHRKQQYPGQTAEELQAILEETKITQSEQLGQFTEIQVQKKNDDANRKMMGDLLEKIEEQSKREDNWAKLNEVIGSADGKKFRQVAQEFTLDVLLGFANVHLDVLNRRYLLQRIPNTLALQVVDRDMGDEVRTVYSLSGGESFLVSLALALGLASLSSSRMQVESLFIDEGFGSLDLNTLNIAMDALERLHNQGRKVGVISHVQEMTERISVQIKVSKQQSGRSRVEVVG